jgi:hypothetical protein
MLTVARIQVTIVEEDEGRAGDTVRRTRDAITKLALGALPNDHFRRMIEADPELKRFAGEDEMPLGTVGSVVWSVYPALLGGWGYTITLSSPLRWTVRVACNAERQFPSFKALASKGLYVHAVFESTSGEAVTTGNQRQLENWRVGRHWSDGLM